MIASLALVIVMACGGTPPTAAEFAVGVPNPLSNARITTKIRAQYFAAPQIRRRNIDVTTNGRGQVILSGEVDSAYDRDAAIRIARATEGVTGVEDLLHLKSTGGRRDRAAATTKAAGGRPMRRDLWLTTHIQAKYFVDHEVRAANVDVDTRDAVVTLRGTVVSVGIRRQAVAVARNTVGVRDVRDELKVASARAPRTAVTSVGDQWMATMIRAKYFLNPDVKGQAIGVSVADGVVSLSGSVESEMQKTTAVQIAGETTGVTGIRDYLQVRSQERVILGHIDEVSLEVAL